MTREEAEEYAKKMSYRDAINNLMKARSIPYRKATFIKVNELLKALEQEPCDDAISRRAVLKELKESAEYHANDSREEALLRRDRDIIRALPSVNLQESKTGRWIVDVDRWGDVVTTVNGYRCDKCNAFNTDRDNYCPHCGAKMVEPQERSEE